MAAAAMMNSSRRTLSILLSRGSRYSVSLLNHSNPMIPTRLVNPTRPKTSGGSGYSPLNDPSPNWSNRPPKETILLDGCDYEHWLIVMEFDSTTNKQPSSSSSSSSEDDMVNTYVQTLAQVLGSEEEAKKKIYSVCTTTYTGFGALISEELSYKVKELPGVLWVLPDSYLDVPNKDYGGDLFVDGKVIHRPQYWYNSTQQQTKHRPRPRHDRRRENMQIERREPFRRENSPSGSSATNQGSYQGVNTNNNS